MPRSPSRVMLPSSDTQPATISPQALSQHSYVPVPKMYMSYEDIKKHITSSDEWGISQFYLSTLSAEVAQFNFVAHENVPNIGDLVGGERLPPTNHWSLFLTISSSSSARVEIAPNEPGEPGMVIAESKLCDVTSDVTKTVSINASKGLTVAHVFSLIIQKKRDYYIFAPVGEGCRWWMYTLADDFVSAKFISEADAHQLQSALGMYWPYPKGTAPVERPMARGDFPNSGLC